MSSVHCEKCGKYLGVFDAIVDNGWGVADEITGECPECSEKE